MTNTSLISKKDKPIFMWGVIVFLLIICLWVPITKWKAHPDPFGIEKTNRWTQFANHPVALSKADAYEFPYISTQDRAFVARKSIGSLCFTEDQSGAKRNSLTDKSRSSPDENNVFTMTKTGRILLSSDKCATWRDIGKDAAVHNHNFGIPGHTSNVKYAAWSPDGQWLASSAWDKSVRIWEAVSGREVQVLLGHSGLNIHLDWSPDGTLLASAGQDGVRIWNAQSGREIHFLNSHTEMVIYVDWSPDGTKLVSASEDNTIRVWDTKTGEDTHLISGHTDIVTQVLWNPQGTHFSSISWDGTIRIWSTDGKEVHRIETKEGFQNAPSTISWSPDGSKLAAGSRAKAGLIIDAVSGNIIQTLSGHKRGIQHIDWDASGQKIATASWDKTVRIWDAKGTLIKVLEGPRAGVMYVDWSPDGTQIAAAASSSLIHVWDVKSGEELPSLTKYRFSGDGRYLHWSADGTRIAIASKVIDAKTGAPHFFMEAPTSLFTGQLSWHEDETKFVSTHFQGAPRIWDTQNGDLLHVFARGYQDKEHVTWSQDGDKIVVSGRPPTIWDANTYQETHALGTLQNEGNIVWSPDGNIVTMTRNGTASVWDDTNGQLHKTFETGRFHKGRLALSSDGKFLSKIGKNGDASLWHLNTGEPLVSFKGGYNTPAAWSPAESKFAFVARDKKRQVSLVIWDALNNRLYEEFQTDNRDLSHINWSPDGTEILGTSFQDKTVIIWNVPQKKERLVITQAANTGSADWNADGTKIATGSMDSHIRLWDINTDRSELNDPYKTLTGHTNDVDIVKWNQAGDKIVSASKDKTIRLWDAVAGDNMLSLRSAYSEQSMSKAGVESRSLKQSFSQAAKLHPSSAAVWISEANYIYRFGYAENSYVRLASPAEQAITDIYEFNSEGKTHITVLADGQLYALDVTRFPSYGLGLNDLLDTDEKLDWSVLEGPELNGSDKITDLRGQGQAVFLVSKHGTVWTQEIGRLDTSWSQKPLSIDTGFSDVEFGASGDTISVSALVPSSEQTSLVHYPSIDEAQKMTVVPPKGFSLLWWLIWIASLGGVFFAIRYD